MGFFFFFFFSVFIIVHRRLLVTINLPQKRARVHYERSVKSSSLKFPSLTRFLASFESYSRVNTGVQDIFLPKFESFKKKTFERLNPLE